MVPNHILLKLVQRSGEMGKISLAQQILITVHDKTQFAEPLYLIV